MTAHIAVIDIGKTNAKLALVDRHSLTEIAVVTRPNTVRPGPPWPHFDVDGHWAFLLDALAQFHAEYGVDAISVTTHGACVALIGHDGELAAPILDYEHDGPDEVAEDYAAIRPSFTETGSPHLAGGLNVGAQLFWQLRRDPTLKSRVRHIMTYPQYWGFRLTGAPGADVTSLGCHTDLWNPFERRPSSLVDRLGVGDLLAPTHLSSDVLGTLLPEIAVRTGLSADTKVYCGVHDSNASLLPHLLARPAPFGVVSTGTWVIAMAVGGRECALDPEKDTLVNVNAFGDPVPSARFMGGREHDLLTAGQPVEPAEAEIASVVEQGLMLLPAAAPLTGPFKGREMRWIGGAEPEIGSGERGACVGFYLALVTTHCLSLIGQRGLVIVEGPFAKNACYLAMLSAASGEPVIAADNATGTSQGAAMLDDLTTRSGDAATPPPRGQRNAAPALRAYAERWRAAVAEAGGGD